MDVSKLISALFGVKAKEIISKQYMASEMNKDNFDDILYTLKFDEEVLKLMFSNHPLQLSLLKNCILTMINEDDPIRKERWLKSLAKLEHQDKTEMESWFKSDKKFKILKRAKMKAKQKRLGFRTSIYIQNHRLRDNSQNKRVNDEFMREVNNCLIRDSKVSLFPMARCQRVNTHIYVGQENEGISRHGHIIQCMEAASNGNENTPVFESVASLAILEKEDRNIIVRKDSRFSLTPKYILIRTNDIFESIKMYNSNINEIRIDEFHQVIIINNIIRLYNFYSNRHLQQFLVLLEYFIRNMVQLPLSSARNDIKFLDLMRPLSWNRLLNTKERILLVGLDINVTMSTYSRLNTKEVENNDVGGTIKMHTRSESRVEGTFQFYKRRSQCMMESLNHEFRNCNKAFFEVK